MRILFFGTGRRCEQLLEENKVFLKNHEIVAFADNDRDKWKTIFHGKKVIAPDDIKTYEYDFIFVTTTIYFDAIYKQLTEVYSIDANQIKRENYLPILFEREEKIRHYERMQNLGKTIENNDEDIVRNKRIVVYTAIFGAYDDLKEPEYIDNDIDYICYTDNPKLYSDVWKIRYISQACNEDSRRSAKKYKILPHKYLKEYDISIWIDGSVIIRGDLKKYINRYRKSANIIFTTHPWRNCIYDEAEFSMKYRKFDGKSEIKEQIQFYESEGMPRNNGLISSGFIVRFHNEPDVIKTMKEWNRQIELYSTQCQVSFGYVAWKNKLRYDVADEWIYDNEYIYLKDHLVKRDES